VLSLCGSAPEELAPWTQLHHEMTAIVRRRQVVVVTHSQSVRMREQLVPNAALLLRRKTAPHYVFLLARLKTKHVAMEIMLKNENFPYSDELRLGFRWPKGRVHLTWHRYN
jgi:hypothetical protein